MIDSTFGQLEESDHHRQSRGGTHDLNHLAFWPEVATLQKSGQSESGGNAGTEDYTRSIRDAGMLGQRTMANNSAAQQAGPSRPMTYATSSASQDGMTLHLPSREEMFNVTTVQPQEFSLRPPSPKDSHQATMIANAGAGLGASYDSQTSSQGRDDLDRFDRAAQTGLPLSRSTIYHASSRLSTDDVAHPAGNSRTVAAVLAPYWAALKLKPRAKDFFKIRSLVNSFKSPTQISKNRIAVCLEMNAELIRLLVEFQAKGIPMDEEAAQEWQRRLHGNLTWLAMTANATKAQASGDVAVSQKPVAPLPPLGLPKSHPKSNMTELTMCLMWAALLFEPEKPDLQEAEDGSLLVGQDASHGGILPANGKLDSVQKSQDTKEDVDAMLSASPVKKAPRSHKKRQKDGPVTGGAPRGRPGRKAAAEKEAAAAAAAAAAEANSRQGSVAPAGFEPQGTARQAQWTGNTSFGANAPHNQASDNVLQGNVEMSPAQLHGQQQRTFQLLMSTIPDFEKMTIQQQQAIFNQVFNQQFQQLTNRQASAMLPMSSNTNMGGNQLFQMGSRHDSPPHINAAFDRSRQPSAQPQQMVGQPAMSGMTQGKSPRTINANMMQPQSQTQPQQVQAGLGPGGLTVQQMSQLQQLRANNPGLANQLEHSLRMRQQHLQMGQSPQMMVGQGNQRAGSGQSGAQRPLPNLNQINDFLPPTFVSPQVDSSVPAHLAKLRLPPQLAANLSRQSPQQQIGLLQNYFAHMQNHAINIGAPNLSGVDAPGGNSEQSSASIGQSVPSRSSLGAQQDSNYQGMMLQHLQNQTQAQQQSTRASTPQQYTMPNYGSPLTMPNGSPDQSMSFGPGVSGLSSNAMAAAFTTMPDRGANTMSGSQRAGTSDALSSLNTQQETGPDLDLAAYLNVGDVNSFMAHDAGTDFGNFGLDFMNGISGSRDISGQGNGMGNVNKHLTSGQSDFDQLILGDIFKH